MSLFSQARDIMKKGAETRRLIFGVIPTGEEQLARMESEPDLTKTFKCYFASNRGSAEVLQAALFFKEEIDGILRVAKAEANFLPVDGTLIRLLDYNDDGTDLVVRTAGILTSGINPEWIIGCKSRF